MECDRSRRVDASETFTEADGEPSYLHIGKVAGPETFHRQELFEPRCRATFQARALEVTWVTKRLPEVSFEAQRNMTRQPKFFPSQQKPQEPKPWRLSERSTPTRYVKCSAALVSSSKYLPSEINVCCSCRATPAQPPFSQSRRPTTSNSRSSRLSQLRVSLEST